MICFWFPKPDFYSNILKSATAKYELVLPFFQNCNILNCIFLWCELNFEYVVVNPATNIIKSVYIIYKYYPVGNQQLDNHYNHYVRSVGLQNKYPGMLLPYFPVGEESFERRSGQMEGASAADDAITATSESGRIPSSPPGKNGPHQTSG